MPKSLHSCHEETDMDKKSIFDFMDKVTDVVKAASPIATMLGIPLVEKVAGWADTAVDVGKNAIARADEGKIVLTSVDKADINARIAALESANAALNAEIEAS